MSNEIRLITVSISLFPLSFLFSQVRFPIHCSIFLSANFRGVQNILSKTSKFHNQCLCKQSKIIQFSQLPIDKHQILR